jgi:hypothetical protein
MKIVPKATEICFSSALITGEIRYGTTTAYGSSSTNKKRRFFIYFKTIPNKYPIDKVRTIDSIVNTSPFCPAFNALSTFIPKPSPTTEIWVVNVLLYGLGASKDGLN